MPPRRAVLLSRALCRMTRATATSQAPPSQPPRLVTWDIDGTLLSAAGRTGNAAHKRAIDEAVAHVHDIATTVNDVPHAGCTDIAIVRSMCRLARVPDALIDARMSHVLSDAAARVARYVDPDLSHLVLPGVHHILAALAHRGVAMALTTGNLESAAWAKLRAAGIAHYFVGGAFGSDCEHRDDILRTAIHRVGRDLHVSQVVHVGDAVADVRAARNVGAVGIGVLTGSFLRSQLETERPLAVLDDLTDTTRFLRVIGFDL